MFYHPLMQHYLQYLLEIPAKMLVTDMKNSFSTAENTEIFQSCNASSYYFYIRAFLISR